MIGSLKGTLACKRPDRIIIDVHGVGYVLQVPLSVLSSLPQEGREVAFHVHTHLKEDALVLYGFRTDEERRVFSTLIGISGIGPRIALNILSSISHEAFYEAVNSENVDILCKVPGLGKKTAHRLILELRGKLPAQEREGSRVFDDTLSALVNLGYHKGLARDALEKAYANGITDIEGLLRESLKLLVKER